MKRFAFALGIFIAVCAAVLQVQSLVEAQQHDNVGGGAYLNLTGGSINCTVGLCTIAPNSLLGITGTVTNDTANAGAFGEWQQSTVGQALGVALGNAVPKTVASLTLTPGDWMVTGVCDHLGAANNVETMAACSISTATSVLGTQAASSWAAIRQAALLFQHAAGNKAKQATQRTSQPAPAASKHPPNSPARQWVWGQQARAAAPAVVRPA